MPTSSQEALLGAPAGVPAPASVGGSYADELPCNEEETRHWRHVWCNSRGNGELARNPPIIGQGQPLTVPQCLNNAVRQYGALPCMGTRQVINVDDTGRTRSGAKKILWHKADTYTYETYAEVHAKVQAAAKGLVSLPGVLAAAQAKKAAGSEYIVALLAETSAEWQIAAQASFAAGLTITTVYATLGHEAMLHGLHQTEAEVIFVEFDLYTALKEPVLAQCPCLKHVVLIGKALVPIGAFPVGGAIPDGHKTLDSLIELGQSPTGAAVDLAPMQPTEEDLALVMYTSGSTGVPKGVELTHLNFISVIASAIAQGVITPTPDDTIIAYLPLAHILELMCEMACMMQGAKIAYASPRTLTPASAYNPPHAITDLAAALPTLMAAVPAILEIIRTGLIQKVEGMGGMKKSLIQGAIARAKNSLYDGEPDYVSEPAGSSMTGCLDSMLLGKLKAAFGLQNCRILISGGAPLSAETQRFCTAVFCPVAQG
jgi:long-chain acyl-CoA synthetase